MKVGGGLNYVTGPMGAGKTLYAVRLITAALAHGQYVITNIPLMPNWSHRIARRIVPFDWRKRREYEARMEALYIYEPDLQLAVKYRVPGKGEGRALFVWDESHNDLNNRDWKADGRSVILQWATQLRKLGFVGYFISQHTDNTDAAMRRVCNFVIRMQNQREQVRGWFGVRWTPVPLFLAYWYPAHLAEKGQRANVVKVDRFVLSWHRKLYDTHGLYHGLAEEDDGGGSVIRLPEVGRAATRPVAPALPAPGAADAADSVQG